MMKISITACVAACLLVTGAAYAQDQSQNVSQTETQGQNEGYSFGASHFSLKPTAGAIFYNGNQEFTGGVLADFNLLATPWMRLGPAFGALYSSTTGSSFFNGVNGGNSNYIFQLPANLKLTVEPDAAHRLALGVHGGANIIRTNQAAGGVAFGGTTTESNIASSGSSSWDVHPNVGGDIDFALAPGVALSLRPDVTFLPAFNVFTATLGLGLQI